MLKLVLNLLAWFYLPKRINVLKSITKTVIKEAQYEKIHQV